MIKTFIAMTTYGQIFYNKVFGEVDSETDVSLTAGLISAVYQMTTETEGERIEMLNLERVRTHFKEDVEEKLFIVTVDKAMDEGDTREMLNEIIVRFADKYGEIRVDGMILSDFEPVLDEVVERHLWYERAPRHPKFFDIIAYLALLFTGYWYPMILLDGEARITMPLLSSLQNGTFLSTLVLVGLELMVPIIVTYILVSRSNIRLMLRYMKEFLTRPSRGGYAELLPWWFLGIPIFSMVVAFSTMRWGRGVYYSLIAQTIGKVLESRQVDEFGRPILWIFMNWFLLIDLLIWLVLFPVVIAIVTRNTQWNTIKSLIITTGISLLVFIPSFVFSGAVYQTAMGFHPENENLYPLESKSIEFLLQVSIPIFAFLLAYAYFLSIGSQPLIKRNRGMYKFALPIAILMSLALQQVTFWYIFITDTFFPNGLFRS